MTEQGKKFLSDILAAIELIESFSAGINSFTDYVNDQKTQSAIERQLGIIGEAVYKYDKLTSVDTIQHAREIVGLRNRIIHAYDSIDNSIIWAILNRHIPLLKKEIASRIPDYS